MRDPRWVVAMVGMLAGCATDGESWARSTLGAEGAEMIRRDAARHFVVNVAEAGELSGTEVDTPAAYVRRPLVILVATGDEPSPHAVQFHPLNAKLPDGLKSTSVSAVRGIVVMSRLTRCKGELTAAGACNGGSEPYTRIVLVDRDRDSRMFDDLAGHDAGVISYLSRLPQSSPTASR